MERDGKCFDWWREVLNKGAMIKNKRFGNTLTVKYSSVWQREIVTM